MVWFNIILGHTYEKLSIILKRTYEKLKNFSALVYEYIDARPADEPGGLSLTQVYLE